MLNLLFLRILPIKNILVLSLLFVGMPTFAADVEGWERILMAGDTKCADGSPYSIFVNRGTSSRVVFDFLSGGACWSAETCQEGFDGYTGRVPDMIGRWLPMYGGIYDRKRVDNPFKNDTHVLIPYCTGDIHWGAKDTTYVKQSVTTQNSTSDDKVTIFHRGAINAKAAIDYVFNEYTQNPQDIFVTGCSAGSYGSIWWAPYIKQQKPYATMTQFGDSAAGIVTDTFKNEGLTQWNIDAYAPRWIPGLEGDLTKKSVSEIYKAVGRYHQDSVLSQFHFTSDLVQRWFFKGMGGDQSQWASLMRLSMFDITARTPNYSYYIMPGSGHCMLLTDEFYDPLTTGPLGLPFYDWFHTLVNRQVPEHEPCIGCVEESQPTRNFH